MDDFEQIYADELEALNDLEDPQFNDVIVRGKKSLDFSTPSSRRNLPKLESSLNESLTVRPLEESTDSEDQVFAQKTSKRKRSDNDLSASLSDENAEQNKENKYNKGQTNKKPKLVDDIQPIPEEFDITPPPSPKTTQQTSRTDHEPKSNASQNKPPQSKEIHDDFEKEFNSSISKDKEPSLWRKMMETGVTTERLTSEEKRLTENYDFERKRVLKRIPFERDFISVSNGLGKKFYMELRDEEYCSSEDAARTSCQDSLSFLGVPISVLRSQIKEDKEARDAQMAEESHRKSPGSSYPDKLDEISDMCDTDEIQQLHSDLEECHTLWVDKYSPRRYTELLSDEATNRLLLKWLKLWDRVVFGREKKPSNHPQNEKAKKKEQNQHKFFKKFAPEVIEELDKHHRPMQKVALLCGPPGLGKTTLGHVIAKHAGYNAVEMNASDDRATEVFKQRIEAAIQMKSVLEADPRPNCLVIDEIDGAPVAAINVLLNIMKASDATSEAENATKKKKKKASLLLRPIICICNDLYAPALRQLRQHALVVNFPMTESAKLAGRLMEITKMENTKADLTTLLALCEKAENDIRSCINTLQFVKGRGGDLTPHVVQSMSLGQKDLNKSLLSVLKHVFTMPRHKRKRYVNPYDRPSSSSAVMDLEQVLQGDNTSRASRFRASLDVVEAAGERDKVTMGLFENYLLPKIKDPHMETYIIGSEWFGFQDLVDKQIHQTQNYTLMRYTSFIAVAFHFLFASLAPFKVQYPQGNELTTKRQRSENLMASLVTDVCPAVRKNLNVNVAVMEFLPHLTTILQPSLRPINTQLYSAKEKKEFMTLINIMMAYNLTYRQARTEDGQYTYTLEPELDLLVNFPEMRPKKQLTYAMKQLIAREVQFEKMRHAEWKVAESDVKDQPKEVKSEEKEEAKPVAPLEKREGTTELPNHMRQSLQPKAIKEETQSVARDFFGRKIEKKVIEAKKETKKSDQIGGEVWFCFKEGFSNAVRRTVRVKEFL